MSAAKALKDAVSALGQIVLCSIIMDIMLSDSHSVRVFTAATGARVKNYYYV